MPQLVNEDAAGNGLIGPEKEHREQRTLLRAADVNCSPAGTGLKRPEHPKLDHRPSPALVNHVCGVSCRRPARPPGQQCEHSVRSRPENPASSSAA